MLGRCPRRKCQHKILCVGDCTDMETALTLSSDEVDMGKIESIKQSGGKTVVTLGPVGLEDIFDDLDVTLGDKEMIVVEDLTEEEKEAYVAELLTNESFLSTFNTVEMAANDYAATYGAKAAGIDWKATFDRMVKSLTFNCQKVDSGNANVQPHRSYLYFSSCKSAICLEIL